MIPALQTIGAGGFAREVAAYTNRETYLFADGGPNEIHTAHRGIPTVIAIGDPKTREAIAERLKGFNFDTLVFGCSYPGLS